MEYSEKCLPEFNHPLLKALNLKESSVLVDKDTTPLRYDFGEAWADIAVLHPDTKYVDHRPDWLFRNDYNSVTISLNDIQIEFPVMVMAYKKGEDINLAVPIDITELESETEEFILALKKGTYEIFITNKDRSFKFEKEVE